jgi:hypothetical protein
LFRELEGDSFSCEALVDGNEGLQLVFDYKVLSLLVVQVTVVVVVEKRQKQ